MTPATRAFVAGIRRQALSIVSGDGESTPSQRFLARAELRGELVSIERLKRTLMPQPNHGAARRSPEWPMSAVVIEAGAADWGANDA